jgi:hypothetical protein
MALPLVDFAEISALSQEAIAVYGTTVEFIEQGAPTGRPVKCVLYRNVDLLALLQDVQGEPARLLLSPADFQPPKRFPQQFDTIVVSVGGFKRIYSIDDVHSVLAADELPMLIVTLKGN